MIKKEITVNSDELKAIEEFRDEVCNNGIDPHDEYDWYSLSMGFFIAKGVTVERAEELSCMVRYDAHYFDGSIEVISC